MKMKVNYRIKNLLLKELDNLFLMNTTLCTDLSKLMPYKKEDLVLSKPLELIESYSC